MTDIIVSYILNEEYVQGMNFIVGSFLYHADEYIVFWLIVELLENFDMRFIYCDGKLF